MVKWLTERQQHVLAAVVGYIRAHGRPPTIAELAVELEVSGTTAAGHLSALERKGYLRRDSHRARAICVVER